MLTKVGKKCYKLLMTYICDIFTLNFNEMKLESYSLTFCVKCKLLVMCILPP